MSHTPGKWVAECVGMSSAGDDGVEVYEVGTEHTRVCEYANEADARLIAAAPDLLEACQLALEHGDLFNADADKVRSAIAKAEGK